MITFSIAFHGPFHVGTGEAEEGMDRTVDRDNLLPATSLKGLMRAEAVEVLGVDPALVADIFGAPGRAGAWWWSDGQIDPIRSAETPERPLIGRVARIRVDDAGLAMRGFLALGEHVWAEGAHFTVGQLRELTTEVTSRHTTILRAAARSVVSLGGARRRGEGWVTIVDDQGDWTAADTTALLSCRSAS
jgi:hypothetical protein